MIDVPNPEKQIRYEALRMALERYSDADYRWILSVAEKFEDYINNGAQSDAKY